MNNPTKSNKIKTRTLKSTQEPRCKHFARHPRRSGSTSLKACGATKLHGARDSVRCNGLWLDKTPAFQNHRCWPSLVSTIQVITVISVCIGHAHPDNADYCRQEVWPVVHIRFSLQQHGNIFGLKPFGRCFWPVSRWPNSQGKHVEVGGQV